MDYKSTRTAVKVDDIAVLASWLMAARPSISFDDCVFEALHTIIDLNRQPQAPTWRSPVVLELARTLLLREPNTPLLDHFKEAIRLKTEGLTATLMRGGKISGAEGAIYYVVRNVHRGEADVTQVIGDIELYAELNDENSSSVDPVEGR